MPIIDRKTVTFHTTAIEGADTIKYVDALYQNAWQPFNESWEAYGFEAYNNNVEVTDSLPGITLDRIGVLVNQHSANQHEND